MANLSKKFLILLFTLVLPFSVQAKVDADLLAGLKARNIGPASISGRVAAIDVVERDTNIIYLGTASGGIWKSENAGLNWQPIFDKEDVASIGALAINQNNPDIIWVGTGEGNVRNSVSVGGGMYKSLDGGKSWQKIGLGNTEHINRIALDPSNPDVAYVAAVGKLWGENKERGLFKTTDGGKTWKKILYINEKTGVSDVVMDPSNPKKLYASTWQVRRWPWFFESGGPGSGMYISHDAGETWERKTEEDGLPAGDLGRITFAVSRSHTNIVYALVEAEKSAIIRSEDGGHSWTKVNQDDDVATRPFYFGEIEVDPKNPNRVYNIAFIIKASDDGGRTFKPLKTMLPWNNNSAIHVDHHAVWIDPNDPRHLIDGNDGGVGISHDGGDSWRFVSNLPLAQFYHINVDNDLPYHIYGGLQDNGSWRGPSEVWENGGIRNFHWQEVGFGDGFDTIPDPRDSMVGYAMSQEGYVSRYDMHTGERKSVRPAHPDPKVKLRFNWNAGMELDPFDPDTLYFGSQFVHKSTDGGQSWNIISDDMTTNNPAWQKQDDSGGIVPDATGAENFTTIISIAASRVKQGVIWVGTDDGRIHVSQDAGKSWTSVEKYIRGVPKNTWVPHIEPSPHDASVAYVVFDNHRRSDIKPYVYRVEKYGRKWKSLATKDIKGYALSIKQDPVDPNLLFLGTEFGLYFSIDAGKSWSKWTQGVPTVSVMDMAIQERESDLVLGTHGRAAFVIDDYSALRHLSEKDFSGGMKLLSVTDGQQYRAKQSPSTRFAGSGGYRAPNEPYGAMITFMMSGADLPHPDADKEKARKIALRASRSSKDDKKSDEKTDAGKYKATVTITDKSGKVIRTFKQKIHQGINRIIWNMGQDSFKLYPAKKKPEELPSGLHVLPGTYGFTVAYGNEKISGELNVLADPRFNLKAEDRQANFDANMRLGALQNTTVEAIERIQAANADIDHLLKLANGQEEANKELTKLSEDVKKELDRVENLFWSKPGSPAYAPSNHVAAKIGSAQYLLASHWDKPTQSNLRNIRVAEVKLEEALKELNAVFTKDVAAFRAKAGEYDLAPLKEKTPLEMPK